jgi:phospholipid/cholesterol/gamma-HCH transport system ATP-binding protein
VQLVFPQAGVKMVMKRIFGLNYGSAAHPLMQKVAIDIIPTKVGSSVWIPTLSGIAGMCDFRGAEGEGGSPYGLDCANTEILHYRSEMTSEKLTTSTIPIELRNVSISFGEKQVLSDISFQLGSGETLILLGVTGSGKSVLLKLIAGLIKPDSGEILIQGQNIVPLPESRLNPFRKLMGIVFQEGALFDSLSVYENVAYPLREAGKTDEDEIEQAVRQVLSFVEMEEAIDKMPAQLSGGMRRRVSIARAIVSQPSIMLYDSPTAGLDPVTANTINILIAKLRDIQHVSSILVTQRVQDAFYLSTNVYSPECHQLVPANSDGRTRPVTRLMVLRDGQIYFLGTREDLMRLKDPYLVRFVS